MHTRGAQAYRQTEAQSRSPLELVVMLYDGALRFVGNAAAANTQRDLRARGEAISRALAVLGELQGTLNLSEGGDVARELDRLYGYMQQRLLDVTMKNDGAALTEVEKLLTPLRASWAEIATRSALPVAR
jgi:flagellar protein FliS